MLADLAVVVASHRPTVWNSGNYGTTLTLVSVGGGVEGQRSCLGIRPYMACLGGRGSSGRGGSCLWWVANHSSCECHYNTLYAR